MADNNYEIDVTLEETFGTGVRSVEQTATSAESGGMNEITVTLTNDQENKFYVMNGLAGKDGRDGGFPVAVGEASLMTDKSKIYLYVGIEEGYTQNHLYYWDGEAWHDYGTYGAPADYLRSASVTHEQGLDQLGNTTYTADTLTLEGNADGSPVETEFVQKLYYSAGENVDGALTQKATSEAIESAQYLPIVNHPNAPVGSTDLSVELQQNVMNVIGGVGYAFTTITMTLATKKAGRVNRYFGRFTTGGNAFAVTWPTGVTVPSALSYKTQTTYDFVIEDSILHVWEDGNAVGDVLDATATANAVSTWLTNHPEATTTVADGSITTAKLASGVIDQTLTVSGAAADSKKVGDELNDLKSQISDIEEQIESGTGDGLTSAIKSALLQLAQNVAYKGTDGQTYIDDLYDALYPPIVYTAITLNKSSLPFGSLNTTQTLVATTTPRGGNVTWSSSNTSVATVSQTGVVTSVGYGNATITATCGNLSATCSVVIAQATVTSISAVYTQSGSVYEGAMLDTLKPNLVVTALWDNGGQSIVNEDDYTLSGQLAVGTSTITVSYEGNTATFNVTVSASYYDYVPTATRGKTFDLSTGEVISAGQYSAIDETYIPVEENTVIVYTNFPGERDNAWIVVMYDSSKNYIKQVNVNQQTNTFTRGISTEDASFIRVYWYNSKDSNFVANFRIYNHYNTITADIGDINATTGDNTEETKRARTLDYIPASEAISIYGCPFGDTWAAWCGGNYGYGVRCYDSSKQYLENLNLNGLSRVDINAVALPTGTEYVRLIFQKNSSAFPSIASESKHPFVANGTAYLITEA